MSEKVDAPKDKKISKAKRGKQVRLWVRAKFLSFRRYNSPYPDPKLPKTPIKPSLNSKVSMNATPLNITSVKESLTFTKNTPEKLKTDLEYILYDVDHLGQNHNQSR